MQPHSENEKITFYIELMELKNKQKLNMRCYIETKVFLARKAKSKHRIEVIIILGDRLDKIL